MLKIKLVLFLILLSTVIFAMPPLSSDNYLRELKRINPNKNIALLRDNPDTGVGYVEVRGEAKGVFEFGDAGKFFTLLYKNNNNEEMWLTIKLPEDVIADEFTDKNVACVLSWNVISLNSLNGFELVNWASKDEVEAYEGELNKGKSRIDLTNVTPDFVMPNELATADEIRENKTATSDTVSCPSKTKVVSIIRRVNPSISAAIANNYAEYIMKYSIGHGVDPFLVCAVITAESRFRNVAKSGVGAQGLGQLMPGTAASIGVANAFDPEQNIYGTAKYLKMMSEQLCSKAPRNLNYNDIKLVLAGYNAGPGAVKKHNGVPPYFETQNYVVKVMKYYQDYLGLNG